MTSLRQASLGSVSWLDLTKARVSDLTNEGGSGMREFEAWTQEMMALGAQQENYESTVINLIASDNASPRHSSPLETLKKVS